MTHNVRCDIKTLFGLAEVPIYERYLGLPAMVGRNRRYFFRDLKLSCWQDKSFSCGGKEVLIKAVAQAIPSYTMSVFCLPGFLSDAFQRQFNAFWWGSNEHRRRIHWMGWRKMSQPKKLGGLGFQDLVCFNQSMLAKQGSRLLLYDDLLVTRVLRARYFRRSSFLRAELGSNPSYIW